jgi:amino acid adenylation domain-containing protein
MSTARDESATAALRPESVLRHWHVAALLDDAAERHGDRPFLVGDTTLTYREAGRRSRSLSRWMAEQGVRRGDRIVVVARNRAEIALLVFAAARLGAIFVVINNLIRPYGFEQILAQCEPALVALDETAQELAASVHGPRILFIGTAECPAAEARLDEVVEGVTGEAEPFPGIDVDPASLIFTSGSTGQPRGVVLSHDNIRFAVAAIQERLRYRPEDVIGVFLPLSFDYGLYQLFLAAQAGAAVFLGRPEMAGPELLRVIDAQGISVLPGVPTLFAALLTMLARRPQPLPTLRALTNTGDRLPQAHIEQLRARLPQARIYPMFGLTECKRVSIMLPEELDRHPDSVGRPLAGTEVRVVDDAGRTVPYGEVGELVVRGRHVALGYWRAEAESQQRFRRTNGQARELWSGDYCRMDAEGFLYFHGRMDALLKHRGFRISPLEIEEAACQIAGVSEAGVVQSDSDGALHLFVCLHQPGLTARAIIDGLRSRLEPVKVPDQVHLVDALPKTANRKTDRKQLKQQLAAQASA